MGRALPVEVLGVWLLFAVVAIEILITYSRLPARELYNVSGGGVGGGASRVLVFLNFPTALAAIPVLMLLAESFGRRCARFAVTVAVALCVAVVVFGVVTQANLDAKPINAVAAVGVAAALALTLALAIHSGLQRTGRRRGDSLRIALAALLLALAVPWLAADLGLWFNGVPVLGTLYQTGELRHQPGVSGLHPAVHHGHHHGLDGVLLILTALLLSRLVPDVRRPALRRGIGAYLSLLAAYGAGNIANDFWTEQVVKRGWTDWQIPDVLVPTASVAWGIILLTAAVIYACTARHFT